MAAEGAEFVGDTPEQFTAFLRSEIEKGGKAVKASGARPGTMTIDGCRIMNAERNYDSHLY